MSRPVVQSDAPHGGFAIVPPGKVLDFIDGYVFLSEETPAFIAKNLISRLKQYAETLKTPFFGTLVDYAEEGIVGEQIGDHARRGDVRKLQRAQRKTGDEHCGG
ncbi:MAG: hypothetical protein E6719_02395, partial [Dermabacter sp.]|nr:hypothetical protein [Dermabacter sp.]